MMMAYHFADILKMDEAIEHIARILWVQLYCVKFTVAETPRLVDDLQRDFYFAQIVQQRRQ